MPNSWKSGIIVCTKIKKILLLLLLFLHEETHWKLCWKHRRRG